MPKVSLNERISEHFYWKDYLKSPMGSRLEIDFSNPPQEVIDNIFKINAIEEIAHSVLGPIINVSGWRPVLVNEATPGFRGDSAHLEGAAVDFFTAYHSQEEVCRLLMAEPRFMEKVDQLICERGVIHIGAPCKAFSHACRHEFHAQGAWNRAC